MQIHSTKKHKLDSVVFGSNFYSQNNATVYISNKKGKSLEHCVDNLIPKNKGFFIFDDEKHSNLIHIVSINSLTNTISFNIEDESENKSKTISIFKHIALSNHDLNIYYFENSLFADEVKNNKFFEKFKLHIVKRKKFLKVYKSTKSLSKENTHLARNIGIMAVLLLCFYIKSNKLEDMSSELGIKFNNEYSKLETELNEIKEKTEPYKGIDFNQTEDFKIAKDYKVILNKYNIEGS